MSQAAPHRPRLALLLLDVSHDLERVGIDQGHAMLHPPAALLALAAYLRQQFGPHELSVEVLDLALAPGGFQALTRAVERLRPDVVGIRSLSHTHAQLHRAAGLVKQSAPAALVLGGGPYANTSPARLMADPNLDAICIAEGERALRDLLRVLLAGRGAAGFQGVRGIHFRHPDSGELVQTPPMPMLEDLDSLPFADYGEIDLARYAEHHAATCVLRPYAVIMASRGCPYSCTFCHNLFGKRMRYRSGANVALEMQQLFDRHGVRDFLICDNIFNIHLPRAKQILRSIAGLAFGPRLYFPNGLRGDSWDPEYLDLLAAAGTVELVYAVESASPRVLSLMRKELSLQRVIDCIHESDRRGIMVNAFFMLGFPGETEQELQATVDLACELMQTIHFPFVQVTRAWEHGAVYQLARQQGFGEAFMQQHASMRHGFQEAIAAEHNFLPGELLRRARLQVALQFSGRGRMRKMLPRQRELFDQRELVQKYATYFGSSRRQAREFLAGFEAAGPKPQNSV